MAFAAPRSDQERDEIEHTNLGRQNAEILPHHLAVIDRIGLEPEPPGSP